MADCNDPATDLALRKLIAAAYHTEVLIPEKHLAAQVDSHASMQSFFLVAEENGEVIGCNGFLANDFYLNDTHYVGYQSCWAATHPLHQGKKVFSSLTNEAKTITKEKGAGFLYGIANDQSNPILKNKLDFIEIPAQVLRIPNLPLIKNNYFQKGASVNYNNACVINEEQVRAHKYAQTPGLVKLVKFNESWLWGKLIMKKKYGIKIPVFYVGGVQLKEAGDLEGLMKQVFRLHKPWFLQFFSCSTNSFNGLLKGWKKPKMNGFIFYNLGMRAFDHFNLMIGVLDVF